MNGLTPLCPYCKAFSQRVTGETVYPHRPDLADKVFYVCTPCDARVGTHAGTGRPLGRLANADLRKAKVNAHNALDPYWQDGRMTRTEAYRRLAELMDIPIEECHIGEFTLEQCERVESLCREGVLDP